MAYVPIGSNADLNLLWNQFGSMAAQDASARNGMSQQTSFSNHPADFGSFLDGLPRHTEYLTDEAQCPRRAICCDDGASLSARFVPEMLFGEAGWNPQALQHVSPPNPFVPFVSLAGQAHPQMRSASALELHSNENSNRSPASTASSGMSSDSTADLADRKIVLKRGYSKAYRIQQKLQVEKTEEELSMVIQTLECVRKMHEQLKDEHAALLEQCGRSDTMNAGYCELECMVSQLSAEVQAQKDRAASHESMARTLLALPVFGIPYATQSLMTIEEAVAAALASPFAAASDSLQWHEGRFEAAEISGGLAADSR